MRPLSADNLEVRNSVPRWPRVATSFHFLNFLRSCAIGSGVWRTFVSFISRFLSSDSRKLLVTSSQVSLARRLKMDVVQSSKFSETSKNNRTLFAHLLVNHKIKYYPGNVTTHNTLNRVADVMGRYACTTAFFLVVMTIAVSAKRAHMWHKYVTAQRFRFGFALFNFSRSTAATKWLVQQITSGENKWNEIKLNLFIDPAEFVMKVFDCTMLQLKHIYYLAPTPLPPIMIISTKFVPFLAQQCLF